MRAPFPRPRRPHAALPQTRIALRCMTLAKLSSFRTDSQAIQAGEWVRVDDEYGDLEILTRGFTDAYFDAQARRQHAAARGFGGDANKLPSAIRRAINVECVIEHMVLDVRNLVDDQNGGRAIPVQEFKDLLRNADYAELVVACFRAAGKVGQRRAMDLEEAVGNSPPPSSTKRRGDASPPS
jgi:hypothetical protein